MTYNQFNNFPLPSEYFPLEFQESLIKKTFEEVRAITQAPDALVYMTVISSVSLALQGKINIESPMGKIGPVSLMALTIAESGERKSTVENLLTKGIKEFQQSSKKTHLEQMKKYKIKLDLHLYKAKELKDNALLNFNDEDEQNKSVDALLAHEKVKPIKPALPFLMFEDSTSEALLSELSDNRPNGFLASSEGGVLLNSRTMSQTAKLNALWSGDDITVTRKSVESFILNEARLTTHIMTQRSALDLFIKKSNDNIRGNGFLSRFLVCAPFSNCGNRYSTGIKYSKENLQKFNDRLYELLSETAKLDDYTNRKTICLSDAAKSIFLDVSNDIECKMGPGGMYERVKDHASKLPENILRLAALLYCFESNTDNSVSEATLRSSINLVAYFSGQFIKVFDAPPKYVVDSENLKIWLESYMNTNIRYIKKNNILQFGPAGSRNKKDLEPALNHLKISFYLTETRWKRTAVLDLFPRYPPDEVKLQNDLLNIAL